MNVSLVPTYETAENGENLITDVDAVHGTVKACIQYELIMILTKSVHQFLKEATSSD